MKFSIITCSYNNLEGLKACMNQVRAQSDAVVGSVEHVVEFIVPLPEKAFLTAKDAGTLIEKLLRIETFSPDVCDRFHGKRVVRRLYLTSSRAFKSKLRERRMGNPLVEQTYRRTPMPHFIWVCEFSTEELYREDKAILGEILWDSTMNPHEFDGWIALHYPDKLYINGTYDVNGSPPGQVFTLSEGGAYPLFRSNLHTL